MDYEGGRRMGTDREPEPLDWQTPSYSIQKGRGWMEPIRSANRASEAGKGTAPQRLGLVSEEF